MFDISLPNFNNQAESVEGDLIFNYEFRVLKSSGSSDDNVVADINLAVNSYVTYLGKDARSDENNRNATIKRRIVDINSNPVSGVEVENKNAIDEGEVMVQTDENGDTVYTKDIGKEIDTPQGIQTETIHSRCAELSHDNSYLAVGSDDGDFWLLDWQNDTVLWTYQTHGQVRNIVFNEENSMILVSSGDSFMYGFDIDGNLLFKTYVGSWATDG